MFQRSVVDTTTDQEIEAGLAESIRANYLGLAPSSMMFASFALAAIVAVFWTNTDSLRLIGWASAQCLLFGVGFLIARSVSPKRFLKVAAINEALQSTWWAMLPLVALPLSPDWQVLQGLVLVSLLLATLGNATASRRLHLAATLPLGLITAAVFTWRGDGAAQWIGAAVAVSLPFTLSAGSVLRQVQSDLFEGSLRNKNLASSLRREGNQLMEVNGQLEIANKHLDEQSRRDPLTDLYNRAGFTSVLNEAVANRPGKVVVCYLDLDRFKRVNDAFGHRFGDLVLKAASQRISRILRPNEVLARQGGDELTLLGYINEMDELDELGSRILSVFDDPFLIEDRQIEVRVSAGLVWLAEPTSADDLMRFADTALYKAKENGRSRYEVFDDNMRSELNSRTKLQADLGTAFDRSEITPFLQPIVDTATGEIFAAEALARWRHSDGVRTANDFIDSARDLGMLDRINDAVAVHVLEFQRAMHRNGRPSCAITVNTSPIHLEAMLNRVLNEEGIDPVMIEITEDGIFSDLDGARRLLHRAQEAGIGVLLDDFGVGFSSLSIATELPINGFKIDRGFVASLAGNRAVVAAVEAIIQLARRMDLHVVAEGVETIEQLQLLRRLGVRFAQGYLFSEAVPMETFSSWLLSGHQFDVYATDRSPATV